MLDDCTGMPHWQGSVSALPVPTIGTWPDGVRNNVVRDAALGSGDVRTWSPLTRPSPVPRGWVGCHRCHQWPAEVFRDEEVAFASGVWRGGDAELLQHQILPWSSSMHDGSARDFTAARDLWVDRRFDRRIRASTSWPWQAGTYPAQTGGVLYGVCVEDEEQGSVCVIFGGMGCLRAGGLSMARWAWRCCGSFELGASRVGRRCGWPRRLR